MSQSISDSKNFKNESCSSSKRSISSVDDDDDDGKPESTKKISLSISKEFSKYKALSHQSDLPKIEDGGKDTPRQNLDPKTKISFGLAKSDAVPKITTNNGSSFSVGKQKKETSLLKHKIGKAAAAFSADADDDEEEMPPEAKMRMKNIGRDTPTSSGPNSFGKSRMGFCDTKKMMERKFKDIQDNLSDE